MKLWLTSSELAELALPGMPTSKRNVNALAEREGWADVAAWCRPRAGRGGGLEYNVRLLPVAARVAYFSRITPAPAEPDLFDSAAGREIMAAPEPVAGTSAAAGLQMDARLAIIGAFARFERRTELTHDLAATYFADIYKFGQADVPPWARAAVPRLSKRTLQRWLAAKREGEIQSLAVDRGAARRGCGVFESAFDGEIKHFILAAHSFNDLYSARQLYETALQEFGAKLTEAGLKLPGQRAFELQFTAWKQEYRAGLMRMMDPDGFRSKMRVSGSYAHMAPHLNALWQIDASPVDALCVDGRHSIYVCIDIWSRRVIVLISRTPRSEAVQLLMRKAILAWGVPEAVKTDNGSDFVARASVRLFAKLDIEAIRSAAFSPWQKGPVERAIRTFQSDCATMLPGFVGHSVAHRKTIEGRKAFSARLGRDDKDRFQVTMTGAELQAIVDDWAQAIYAHHEHGGIGKLTPFARAASSTRTIRTVDPDALASLLMPAPDSQGIRTVGKQGIRIDGFQYWAPGLVVGDRVFVRLDPADAGHIWCFDEEGEQFLARGACPELAGEDRAALMAETKAKQKQLIDAQMAEVTAMTRKRVTQRTVLDNRLALAAAQSSNLVAFPPRSESHTTPALDAGLEIAAMRLSPRRCRRLRRGSTASCWKLRLSPPAPMERSRRFVSRKRRASAIAGLARSRPPLRRVSPSAPSRRSGSARTRRAANTAPSGTFTKNLERRRRVSPPKKKPRRTGAHQSDRG